VTSVQRPDISTARMAIFFVCLLSQTGADAMLSTH
jgi:hypothetical protein